MTSARNVMILASAGSGKTFALTNRFVALLAGGAKPERIVALTFTRKAAGEFFDEILNKLAGAAGADEKAAKLGRDIGRPNLRRSDFLRMLRGMIDAAHRLRLGTIDGFFARVVRAFPLELGLGGDFEILQEHAARLERRRVLRRLFSDLSPDDSSRRAFIEEFKRATFGQEEKRLGARLDHFLDEHHEILLSAPERELWGDPLRIWPGGSPWLDAPARSRAESASALRAWLAAADLGAKQRGRWEAFLAGLEAWSPGAELPDAVAYVLAKALDAWGGLGRGEAALAFDRQRQPLTAAAGAALAELARGVFAAELGRRLASTRGIHAILDGYERGYHDLVRRQGRLTFADVQRMLQPAALGTAGGDGRLAVDFRLDGAIDHWLLDEFQDTSFGQWSILRNLVDEAVQDAAGGRSLFCVGDVKQAIYSWREGDPRLFREIFDHYNRAEPGTIAEEHLDRSWRSGPPVIEMVNSVFRDRSALESLFPGAASASWSEAWRDHESAVPGLGGHAALLVADDEAGRWASVVRVLAEIDPMRRGLSCAVLVQRNDTASDLADYLRREGGWPAVAESDLRVCVDNPLGAALLALAQAAAHPGDRMAWEHARMTPLRAVLAAEGWNSPSALSAGLLARIHAEGFERCFEGLLRGLEPGLRADDRFSRERARQFAEAASTFDRAGGRNLDEFIEYMERYTTREPEAASTIRVMTIHKSKGLGFDVVLLPDLEGRTLLQRREGLAVQKAADRSVQWVLELPPKLFREHDEVLRAHVEAAQADGCYEKLSLFYVAMTRAKRGLYAIVEEPGKSKSCNFPRLLAETLGADRQAVRLGGIALDGAWSSGDPDWHRAIAPAAPSAPPSSVRERLAASVRAPRWSARRPSVAQSGSVPGAGLFALEAPPAEFGAALHALLAEVEWSDVATARRLASAWSGRPAADEAAACLASPELAQIWARPAGSAEVWRELAFEVVAEGAWLTGKFDRVAVTRDAAGRAIGATVWDFKTDRLADGADWAEAAGRHAGQLGLYRKAVALLAGLPEAAVSCEIVFTAARRRVPLPTSAT